MCVWSSDVCSSYLAYTGQAWNVMMGFAGQLSLGHSLYVGVGAYAAAAVYVHYGLGPWAGAWIAVLASMACGLFVGFLPVRLGLGGVYFALLQNGRTDERERGGQRVWNVEGG